jgi:hypothetical protein
LTCNHIHHTAKHSIASIASETPSITPEASGCEECEKEGTEWVALYQHFL